MSLPGFNDTTNRIEATAFKKRGGYLFPKYQYPIIKHGAVNNDEKLSEFYGTDSLSGKGVLIPVYVIKKIGNYRWEKLPHYYGDIEYTIREKKRICITT